EVAGAVRAAVQVPTFGSAADALSSWSARDVAEARSKSREDRIEVPDDIRFAADHEAVAAFASPDTAAGPDVDIVDAAIGKLFRAPNVVDVIGIAAVDEDVIGREMGLQVGNRVVHGRRRNHQPDRARSRELRHEIRERGGTDRLLTGELFDRL